MRAIDAVVFDLGGVLVDWNPRHLYRQLFDDEADMECFLAEICSLEWHVAHDLGHDIEASCAELAARHPEHADLIRAWADRSEEMVRGAINQSIVGAGLNPVDGVFGNDDDTVVAGSSLRTLSARSADENSRFYAAKFGSVKLGKKIKNLPADGRFRTV